MAQPHQVLGVAENADEATINAAFREAAKRLHPDLNNGDVSGIRQLRRLISARDFLTKGGRRFASAQNELRLPLRRQRPSARDLYFAFATMAAASVLSATILFADWGADRPKIIAVEKTAQAEADGLPDADSAGLKAIRDIQEASFAPPETEISAAPEPQLQSVGRRHRSAQRGYALKKAINHAAFMMSKTFRKLASQ